MRRLDDWLVKDVDFWSRLLDSTDVGSILILTGEFVGHFDLTAPSFISQLDSHYILFSSNIN